MQDALDHTRGGLSFHERERDDLSSPTFNFFAADDVVRPIGALDENVRPDLQDGFQRRVFIERADIVHRLQGAQNLTPFVLGKQRPERPFQPLHRVISINRNDESVAQGAGAPQEIEMPGMKNVEATVGENDFLSGSLELPNFRSKSVTRIDRHVLEPSTREYNSRAKALGTDAFFKATRKRKSLPNYQAEVRA